MAVVSGGDFQLEVETAVVGVYAVVSDLHTWNDDIRRGISNYPVFDKSVPYRKVGKQDISASADGYDNPADAGQARLNLLSDAGTEAKLRYTRDGAVGFTVQALTTSRRRSASAEDESLQGRSYEFMFTTTPVVYP